MRIRKVPMKALRLVGPILAGLMLSSCAPAVVPGEFCADQNGNAVPRYVGYQCCQGGGQCQEDELCYGVDECRPAPGPNDVGAPRTHKRL